MQRFYGIARIACFILMSAMIGSAAHGQANLLRNGDFQDDWLTLLPELKNHHWNYTTEVFNRRDYNPDGWQLSGNWKWQSADLPRGQRRLTLAGGSRAVQGVNWITVHNPAKLSGWPDAGGYPTAEAVRSKTPLALVRDLTFSVRLAGKDVPTGAGTITVVWSSAAPGEDTPAAGVVSASVAIPEGTGEKTVEVKLPAATWLAEAQKDPAFAAQGGFIPMSAVCEIVYAAGKAGSVEVLEAALVESGSAVSNLLAGGGFEPTDKDYPAGWSRPQKYRYFPPGIYYIFNTWHNSNSDNRGQTGLDQLVVKSGRASLQMIVPTGDEVCVTSDPITLSQTAPRLIEVQAWVKTHQLCMLQIDAEDESGKRLNGFNFIHKNPLSIGTNDWRLVRQVFAPAAPLKTIRLKLAARGMNGYTLGGTGHQPQQNVAGVVWWDDVRLCEPETPAAELAARGVKIPPAEANGTGPHLEKLDLGEGLLGQNEISAEIVNPGPERTFNLRLSVNAADRGASDAKETPVTSAPVKVPMGQRAKLRLAYLLKTPGRAYDERLATLVLADGQTPVASTRHALTTWTTPLDLELGALYLQPEQKQFVRVNFGLTHAELSRIKELRLEVLRRGTGEVLKTFSIPATLADLERQRTKLPDGLRDDLRNLLLADLDVSFLPLQPFTDPQRNWVLRATAVDSDGKATWAVMSAPFCRLAHDNSQPPIVSARVNEQGEFLLNDKPWMPWGVAYGHNPVCEGPADSGKYLDLANLKPWSLYDRHGGNLSNRALWDGNCVRHVETGKFIPRPQLEELWKQGLYTSTAFLPPAGKPWPDDHLAYLRTAPMVAAVSRGPEEAFGYFTAMSAAQLADVKGEVELLRKATGKPVMVGHGGYWTRLEFEPAPFFDVYDPETEPWYPAPVHTDLAPLVAGKAQAIWLRPQMYESVPYERWRYHVYVELVRGARGWQVAHGPGDASTFRGLHAELRHLRPAIYSREKPPAVSLEPNLEHLVRQTGNKTIIIAATTHGMTFGNWRASEEKSPAGLARVTADPHTFRDESDGYHATGEPAAQNLCPHGIQYLTDPKKWLAGSKLVTWVKLDLQAPPKSLAALVKADGRWTYAAAWGPFDLAGLRGDNARAFWFLRTFYRHARGFLGWGDKVLPYAMEFLPAKTIPLGDLPKAGQWTKLEIPLDKLGAADKLVDGIGFVHDGGRVCWANTVLVSPDGREMMVFGEHEDRPPPDELSKTKITVAGLKKGAVVRVLFEDRIIIAEDGYFSDDFSGSDLYQRYGGERSGYGNAPVAMHVYEVTK